MADEVWLDVLPNMGGFAGKMVKGAVEASKTAGTASGKAFSKSFAKDADGASDGVTRELEVAAKRSEAELGKLKNAISTARQAKNKAAAAELDAQVKLNKAVSDYGEDSDQARAAALRLAAANERAATATKKFENAEEALKAETENSKNITEQLTAAHKKQERQVGRAPSKWNAVKKSISGVGRSIKSTSSGMGGMVAKLGALAGAATAAAKSIGDVAAQGDSAGMLGATLGATPEEAGKWATLAGDIYADNFGESVADVSGAIDAVVSSMQGMRDASEEDLESVTTKALSLAQAMGVDVAETASTAGILIKSGLAKDGTEAMDMLAGSMQKVPKAMRAEILPVMSEYSKHFEQLGIDGDTAMGMIVASSADGAIGMDKMGDSLKEFGIRATDMSKSTTGVYESLGLSSKEMTNELLAGGDRAETAMAKIVHGLQGIEDPGEQAAAAISLFGTPLEDLGTDKIPDFLGMIDPMGDAFDSTKGAADQMTEALNSGPTASLQSLGRSFIGVITDAIEPFLEPAQKVLDWATETPGVMQAFGIGLGGLATAWGIYTAAQWAANSAMLASPITWVVAGIVAGAALVAVAVANWGSIMEWLQNNVLQPFLDWISPAWNAVMTGIDWAWQNILKPVWDGIAGAADWLWRNALQPAFQWIGEAWQNWTNNAKWAWENILKPVWDAVAAAGTWLWENALQPVFGWIGENWGKLVRGFGIFWEEHGKPTFEAVGRVAKWLWENALSPAFGWIGDKWDKLTRGFGIVWDKYGKPVFETIGNLLKGDFPAAFEAGKKAVDNIWQGVANIVRKPVNFVVNTVYNDGLKSMFNGISSKLGLKWRLPDVDPLPAFAKGGLHKGGWALVGEEGPELVNFSAPGRVYTASETQSMLSGQEQAPEGALDLLAGSSPSEAMLPAGGFWGDVWSNVTSAVGKAKDWVVGKIADGVRALTNPIKSTITTFLPGEGINELIRGGAHKVIDDMVSWAVGADDKKAAEQAAEFGGAVYDGPLGAFHRPSKGPYTSMYGPRWGGFHTGVDIAGGGPVYAALPGVVQRVGWNAVPGKTGIGIYLNHGPGLWTYYGHNPVGGPQVKVGDTVKGGQHIGYQGATGNVTGVHTHFEVHKGRVNGTVNPMTYLHDEGGYIQPGMTQVLNKTRAPEPVFNGAQWRSIHTLATIGAEQADSGKQYHYHAGEGEGSYGDFVDRMRHEDRKERRKRGRPGGSK